MKKKPVLKTLMIAIVSLIICLSGTVLADETIDLGVLPSGQVITKEGSINKQGYIYHSFTVNAPGYMSVNGERISSYNSIYGIDIILCNAAGAPIDYTSINYKNASNADETDIIYGLNPGTYKIRVDATSSNMKYVLALKYTQTKNQAKFAKKKALNLKKGKKYSLVFGAGDKRTVWLKFTANGKKKEKIKITTIGQGGFTLQTTGSKMKSRQYIKNNNSGTIIYYTHGGGKKLALRSGTYYIKITRDTYKNTSNGWMEIQWK